MKRRQAIGLVTTTLVLLVGALLATQSRCAAGKPNPADPPPQHSDDKGVSMESLDDVEQGSNGFAFGMYAQLRAEPGNVFFSPYSITTALAMADEGAKGETASEIEAVFGLSTDTAARRPAFAALHNRLNPKDAKYQLSVANAFWAQAGYRFLPEYISPLRQYYASEANNLDFSGATEQSRETINKWVEDKTMGKIRDLFAKGTIQSATRLVLTNAIYFKGSWLDPFEKESTQDQPFRSPQGELSVPTMQRTGFNSRYAYAENEELQAIELPYEGEQLSMLVLLPKGDELAPLEASVDAEKLSLLRGQLSTAKIDVYLPKFTFSSGYTLNDQLSALGMPTAFRYGDADFSGMDGSHDLYIGLVVHKAFVDVNEEGTEAAAATGVSMVAGSAPAPGKPLEFRADHPFLFFIIDKTSGLILFMGRVVNPVAE